MSWFDEAKRIAANTVLVMENTDQATADMRWAICETCEWNDRVHVKCSICGCYLASKVWSKYSRSLNRPLGELTHCPMGKWHDMDIANHYRQLDGQPPLDEPPSNGADFEDHFHF